MGAWIMRTALAAVDGGGGTAMMDGDAARGDVGGAGEGVGERGSGAARMMGVGDAGEPTNADEL